MPSAARTKLACLTQAFTQPTDRNAIERAAYEFRRLWRFSHGTIRPAFPAMSQLQAYRARRDAYSHYIMVGPRQMYRDEVAAINAAEVVL